MYFLKQIFSFSIENVLFGETTFQPMDVCEITGHNIPARDWPATLWHWEFYNINYNKNILLRRTFYKYLQYFMFSLIKNEYKPFHTHSVWNFTRTVFEYVLLHMVYRHIIWVAVIYTNGFADLWGKKNVPSLWEKLRNVWLHYDVVILRQSHFILLHLWMVFFNEAEYVAASNVHQCGMMKFYN